MNKEKEVIQKLRELIDEMEELYGELEGFEVRLEHPIVEGQKQSFANIKEFVILHLHRTEIDVE